MTWDVFFLKGPDSNYFRFVYQMVSVATIQFHSAIVVLKQLNNMKRMVLTQDTCFKMGNFYI